ncbi:MAG: 8-amino-7-oxononanoate synthase, partial [Campylobacteraceae bacterium]|nr:8-amino-7-oxononanoate synthase [Campylobacteraceae bacterium]
KDLGDDKGGRILLYNGDKSHVNECINYLQSKPVLVTDIPVLNSAKKEKWVEFEESLEAKKADNLFREIPQMQSAQSAHVKYNSQDMLMLASNDYLDLANDKSVKSYAISMTRKFGTGSGGSRLTTGSTPLHSKLESMLSVWKGTEAALLFNTGYMANVGTISAIASKEWVIFSDEKNHASIIDGCRLGRAKTVVYKHNDMDDLEAKVKLYAGRKGLIVSDGVFSMDGDIVNLPRLLDISERYGMYSMIDEAHASGVIGENGGGVCEHFGLKQKPDIIIGTCSKAFGSEGGYVCGKKVLIDFLINNARSFIFSTALSVGVVAASIKALHIIQTKPKIVSKLQNNVRFFCKSLQTHGVNATSETAIIPIVIGDEKKALKYAEKLKKEGFYISAIRYPTVAKGEAMLRVVLMSSHKKSELKAAAKAIARYI